MCVADNGSFNKAAEVLYISPPAVIKQINGLEKSLGFSLFYGLTAVFFSPQQGPPLPKMPVTSFSTARIPSSGPGGPWSRGQRPSASGLRP
ncbi:LysR family transcriptional regulator [Acidaminococcus intestini]|nr:LysR family transcriptional regulator [Acidaminococcus intestini]